jgi:hypothetical protein
MRTSCLAVCVREPAVSEQANHEEKTVLVSALRVFNTQDSNSVELLRDADELLDRLRERARRLDE